MADYTEANERLFLGKQANKSAARRLKGEIGELIDDRYMICRYASHIPASKAFTYIAEKPKTRTTRKRGSGRRRKCAEEAPGSLNDRSPNRKPFTRPHPVSVPPQAVALAMVETNTPVPIARPLPTISGAQARVAKALAQVKSTQAEAQRNLEVAIKDLALLQDQEQDLRKEVERVEGKREWVEEFRGWVEMLGHFLEEKVGCLL